MSNKFLGLDSINVLKEYIDNQFESYDSTSRLITIQAYKYALDNEKPTTPTGGTFDVNGSNIVYPEGWASLASVVSAFDTDNALDAALSVGSIYMSAATIEGSNTVVWSNPIKISGQNGVSVRFKFTYNNESLTNEQIEALSNNPSGVDATNRFEYVYTKTSDENWQGPSLWATYSRNATNTVWRYCVTATDDTPQRPTTGDSLWSSTIPTTNLSAQKPYMWMCYQLVPANDDGTYPTLSNEMWSEPILFGHYGQDGSVPDYTYTLYCEGSNNPEFPELPGIIAPEQPIFVDDSLITDYINEQWVELPGVEDTIWWQCTFKVDGRTGKVLEIGSVKRYNGVDGIAKPGPFTKYIYAWSIDQSMPIVPETLINGWLPENWNELPTQPEDMNVPEASLWMMVGTATGISDEGYPTIISWSDPVKLTGPRGPIAYDYRVETRYIRGTEVGPEGEPDEIEWSVTTPTTNFEYPYIWAKNYLICYRMTYGDFDESINDYPVVPTNDYKIIEDYPYFMLSGINGQDGNRKNSVDYSTTDATVNVKSFALTNLYILNADVDTIYNINLDTVSFVNGYTGKFANISNSGNMIINSGPHFTFVGSCTTADTLTVTPNETIELVCYNNGTSKELIVIGKSLNA